MKILPVRGSLRARGMDVDEACAFCGEGAETMGHVLLFCSRVRQWWFASPLGLRQENEVEFHEFMQDFSKAVDPQTLARFFTLCYIFWEARNALVFHGTPPRLKLLLAHEAALFLPPDSRQTQANDLPLPATWLAPSNDVIKLNFDASWRVNAASGFACVARNNVGEIMAAATAPHMAALSPLLAEAGAFKWTIGLAMDLGFRRVCMETDCMRLF